MVAWLIGVRPGALGFFRAHWIHQGGSTGVNGFIRVRPVGRLVLPGSLRSLGCALGVVGFIQGEWVHQDAP